MKTGKFRWLVVTLLAMALLPLRSVIAQEAGIEINSEAVASAGAVVSAENATQVRSAIVSELYELVRGGVVEFEAGSALPSNGGSLFVNEHSQDASSSSAVPTELIPVRPFHIPTTAWQNEPPERVSQQVLWNVASNYWKTPVLQAELSLQLFREGQVVGRSSGSLSRIYPLVLGQEMSSDQLYRERFELKSPAVLRNYTWLTFRFRSAAEDVFWLYSPAIKQARQLTSSNRSDNLLHMPVSLDDLFGWSRKANVVGGRVEDSVLVFAPYLGMRRVAGPDSVGCRVVNNGSEGGSEVGLAWNFESRRFPKAAGWLPTGVVFRPRRLWRLELASQDLYSDYGRHVLYVDQELQAPYYNFIYNRTGQLMRAIITVFGAFTSVGSPAVYPVVSSVIDFSTGSAVLISYDEWRLCSKISATEIAKLFDPAQLREELPVASPKAEIGAPVDGSLANAVKPKKGGAISLKTKSVDPETEPRR